jgi:hypothetical protein
MKPTFKRIPSLPAAKAGDDALRPGARPGEHADHGLGVVAQGEGVLALVVEAAKKQGVRFVKDDFRDGEIECLQQNVVIFRGEAGQTVYRLLKGTQQAFAGQQAGQQAVEARGSVFAVGHYSGEQLGRVHAPQFIQPQMGGKAEEPSPRPSPAAAGEGATHPAAD